MLCGKIIITNENRENVYLLSDLIKKQNIPFCADDLHETTVINISGGDDNLYALCRAAAEYITEVEIKRDIFRILEKHYSCFNGDEKEIICLAVLKCPFLNELPGRIYIYIKFNGSVNPNGFYRFLCTDIKKAVFEAVSEEADKLISLNDTEDFIQLLKYFASMSPMSTEKADIVAAADGIHLLSCPEADYMCEIASLEAPSEDILSELVTLNPKKIVVHGRKFYEASELSAVINGVFGGRVTYCSGCSICKEV